MMNTVFMSKFVILYIEKTKITHILVWASYSCDSEIFTESMNIIKY